MILKTFLKKFRFYSLDIVTGAICSGILAFKIINISTDNIYIALLALVVFWIYNTDHLLDAYRLKNSSSSNRHIEYFQHRKTLLAILVISSLTLIVLIPFLLSFRTILYGIVTGTLVVLYLIINHYISSLKTKYMPGELIIAVLYTTGIWGGALLHRSVCINIFHFLYIFGFLLLVSSNTFIYSYFSHDEDKIDGTFSFAVLWGKNATKYLIRIFIILSTCIYICLFIISSFRFLFLLIPCLMIIGFVIIMTWPRFFSRNNRFGILADALLIIPIISLF